MDGFISPQQGLLIIKMSRFGQIEVKTKRRIGRIRLVDHLKCLALYLLLVCQQPTLLSVTF